MSRQMKVLLYILAMLLVLMSSTCKKETPATALPASTNESDTGVLALLWRTHLDESKEEVLSINPILNKEQDILMSARYNSIGEPEIIKLYDGKTGRLKWQWKDYLRKEEYFNNNGHAIVNDALILSAFNATYALNMLSGSTIWKSYIDTMYGSASVYSDEEYVYKSFQAERGLHSSYIFRTRYDRLQWELLCTFKDSSKKYDRITAGGIAFAKNDKQEKLLVYTLACAGIKEPWATICCYNITARKVEWIRDYSDKYLEFSSAKLITNGKYAYTFCNWGANRYLAAFRVADGALAWQQLLPDFGVNLFLHENKIICICNGNSPVQSFDQNTGSLVWQQQFEGAGQSRINFDFGDALLLKQYLFSTQCDNLLVLDARDGSIVFNKRVARPGKCLQYGIAVNENSRTFYVQDRTHVNCYKLPLEIKPE